MGVKTPATKKHLLRAVIFAYAACVPLCSKTIFSRLFTPVIASVLHLLLSFAEELEDPFGTQHHDLPWPVMLGNVAACIVTEESKDVMDKTLALFNRACLEGEWDMAEARDVFQ